MEYISDDINQTKLEIIEKTKDIYDMEKLSVLLFFIRGLNLENIELGSH